MGHGKCVTSGPFSDLDVMFFDGEVQPHCLSRGFPEEGELRELGELIRPDAIDSFMGDDRFDTFAGELEKRAHRFLSQSVGGDLSRFTGPNGTLPLLMSDIEAFELTRLQILFSSCTRLILTGFGGSGSRSNAKADLLLTMEKPIIIPKQQHPWQITWIWVVCREIYESLT